MKPSNHDSHLNDLIEQTEERCQVRDHISKVIADLEFSDEMFTDQHNGSAFYDFEGMVRIFLYKEVRGLSQRETARHLEQWPHILMKFGLDRSPRQATLSHTRKKRFSRTDWLFLRDAASQIQKIAEEHGLIHAPNDSPPISPDEIQDGGLTEKEIRRATQLARKHVFKPFSTGRAENAKYDDNIFWEMQAYLSMVRCGTAQGGRRFARMSKRSETPHGDTHERTIKKIGAPNPQTSLKEWSDGSDTVNWKRIRKQLLDPFDDAIEHLLEESTLKNDIREPVNVAIDITPWQFYPSPWKDRDRDLPKEDYPEMVAGLKERGVRGYEFATLTVVGANTPIILAVEPVKRHSAWENDGVGSTPVADVVERLLNKAQQYVEINKVMADREFDTHLVRDTIHWKGMTYLIPKRFSASKDSENAEKVEQHPYADVAVEQDVPLSVDGRTHEVNFMYVPSKSGEGSALFTTNADVTPDRAQGLVAQYRDRWMIENEYKSIKADFLPVTCSKDYRMRMFYFIAATLMYNLWRLTNLVLRDLVDADLGESPPITAGEFVELMAVFVEPQKEYG
ncbi:transposase [Natronococcus amylolyticus]|nr:transposase [Natronococcus amylolyticus]